MDFPTNFSILFNLAESTAFFHPSAQTSTFFCSKLTISSVTVLSAQALYKNTQVLPQKFKQTAGNKNKKNTEQKVQRIKNIGLKMFAYMQPPLKKKSLIAKSVFAV